MERDTINGFVHMRIDLANLEFIDPKLREIALAVEARLDSV